MITSLSVGLSRGILSVYRVKYSDPESHVTSYEKQSKVDDKSHLVDRPVPNAGHT